MDIVQLLDRFEGVRGSGGRWVARCPAHDDRQASLSLGMGDDGRVLIKCHAGCPTDAVVEALGLKMRDLFPAKSQQGQRRQKARRAKPKEVAAYDYRDESGELLYQVVRMEPKTFRQRKPNGNGWTWNNNGVRRVPYHLPELLVSTGQVLVVEGEKDADILHCAGLTATCNSGGAGKWSANLSSHLQGREVVILPDNDQAGQKHAEQVAISLNRIASRIKVVALPGLPDKGDVSDWLANGGDVARLSKLVEATPDWKPADCWHDRLIYTGGESPKLARVESNVAMILTHDDRWRGSLVFDELSYRVRWNKSPAPGLEGQVEDHHAVAVQELLAKQWSIVFNRPAIFAGIEAAGMECRVHPVRDYLQSVEWDGQPRVPKWLHRYLCAEDTVMHSQMGTWWLLSAVARAFRPGCQVDHTLVLEGNQGVGKSSALRVLGGKWYQPTLGSLESKDCYQNLAGHWLVEIAELDSFKGARASRIKDFLTATMDSFRPSYGRFVVDRLRQVVFAATTNERNYLRDSTGGRRFWPVPVGACRLEALVKDRDQLWAETVALYRTGATWWPGQTEAKELEDIQEERHLGDPWEPRIETVLEDLVEPITTTEILDKLGIEAARQGKAEAMRVGMILHRMGWERHRGRVAGGTRQYSYCRGGNVEVSPPVPTENDQWGDRTALWIDCTARSSRKRPEPLPPYRHREWVWPL